MTDKAREAVEKLMPEKKNPKPYGEAIHLNTVEGFNEARRKCITAIADRVVGVEGLEGILCEVEILCDCCEGCGFTGYAKSGKKIACEACGGHEDALGRGFTFNKLAAALDEEFIVIRR